MGWGSLGSDQSNCLILKNIDVILASKGVNNRLLGANSSFLTHHVWMGYKNSADPIYASSFYAHTYRMGQAGELTPKIINLLLSEP